jgi:hypothetical protein
MVGLALSRMRDYHKTLHPKVYRSYIESFYLQLSLEKACSEYDQRRISAL